MYLQNNKLAQLGFKPKLMPALRKMSLGNNAFTAQARAEAEADMAEAGIEVVSGDPASSS